MMRWLRRVFWFALLAAAGYGAYKAVARRTSQPDNAPQWSPLPADRGTHTVTPANGGGRSPSARQPARRVAAPTQRWVTPANGVCPDGYPIKANDSSHIFHVPGGRFYERTAADRCYASADDAVADGYRAAKA